LTKNIVFLDTRSNVRNDCGTNSQSVVTYALGGVSLGGVALGSVALGGVALGGVALGGVELGSVALGGVALGGVELGTVNQLYTRIQILKSEEVV
jgi:hypothetical protein